MTSNNSVINSGLLTVFGLLVAGLAPAMSANFGYGLADVAGIIVVALVYHFFFNE